nr:hypothetical protein [Tanacetum cinerariifolium]
MTSLRLHRCPVMPVTQTTRTCGLRLGGIREPLGAEVDDPMADPVIDELAEPIVEVEEQTVAPAMDMEEYLAVLFGDDDDSGDDDSKAPEDDEEVWGGERGVVDGTRHPSFDASYAPTNDGGFMYPHGNLEYGHRLLVKKVITVSDAEVADSISIGEIGPRVTTVEGHVQVMASQMV